MGKGDMKKVLIIDDDPINQLLSRTMLETGEYEILQAEDGETGIKVAKETLPDLILLDIQMPLMDGITAFKLLQSEHSTKDIPVVALTAYAMEGDREKLLSIGFRDYIAKPVGMSNFLDMVERYVKLNK